MPYPDELELVRRVLAGNRAAFDVLFERFYPPLLAYPALALGPGPRAQALTEASFVELLEGLESYRGEIPLAMLALSVARRLVAAGTAAKGAAVSVTPSTPNRRTGSRA